MKPHALIPTLLATIGLCTQAADQTSTSKLMEMRKKVQKLHASDARGYLQQMETALNAGDFAGADTALNGAIAQGTLTQTQIDEARGRVQTAEFQQRATMVAAAKEAEQRRMAEQQAAAERQQQMAATNADARRSRDVPTPASPMQNDRATAKQETELDRFKKHFQGREVTFTVVHDDGGGFATSNDLVLKDSTTGKKFRVGYTHGLNKSLGNGKTLEGSSVVVVFDRSGVPCRIKNPANGWSYSVDPEWKATGYGW